MHRFGRTVHRHESAETAFAFFADPSNLPKWDPGVRRVAKLTSGPCEIGAVYRVEPELLSGQPVTYTVTEWAPPERAAFRAQTPGFRTRDLLTIASLDGGGCAVSYASEAEFSDASERVQSIRARLFRAAGDAALTGLEGVRIASG
jgi:hypothetical protein